MRKAVMISMGAAVILGGAVGLGYQQHQPAFLFGGEAAAQSAQPSGQQGGTQAKGGRRGSGGPLSVIAVAATTGDLPVRRSTIGWMASTAATTVTTQAQGVVTKIAAQNGQDVKQGDLLVQLDDRSVQATLTRDNAALTRDQATLVSNKADLVRAQGLFQRQIDSQQQLQQATATESSAEATVALDQANVVADKVAVDNMHITAPHDGRLGAFSVTVGSLIQPGGAIVTLTDMDNVEADFTVSDADVDLLRASLAKGAVNVQVHTTGTATVAASGTDAAPAAGAPAQATQDKVVQGTVDFIDSSIASGSGTIAVRAAIPNKNRVLWPGQSVRVDVDLGINKGVAIVPSVAVQQGQAGSVVFVVKPDSTIDVRPVQVAGIVGDKAGIASGLKAGEKVVTEGQLALANGMKVAIRDPNADSAAKAGKPAAGDTKPAQGDAS